MRILVTGGAGFIGSHIVDAYVEAGHSVFVVDDLSTGRREQVNSRADFHLLDILDPKLPKLVAELAPDVVCHHAAQMDLRRSVDDPLFDARVNILGLLHLLEACKNSNLQKLIYASSGGAVYGEQETFPTPEDHPTRPVSPYGVSKLSGEHYLAYYYKVFGISYIALRYSNVYGPRQNARGEAGVVAIFTDHLLKGEPPTINGDGTQTRDYVYVGDVVDANLRALKSPYSGVLNIGTGQETDVLTLYGLLGNKIASNVKSARHGPAKLGEQKRSSLDIQRARETLGWSPRVRLGHGLEQTVEYYRRADIS
jgi:UDP-glucose 4-epimerase